jgi:hypothetical protein
VGELDQLNVDKLKQILLGSGVPESELKFKRRNTLVEMIESARTLDYVETDDEEGAEIEAMSAISSTDEPEEEKKTGHKVLTQEEVNAAIYAAGQEDAVVQQPVGTGYTGPAFETPVFDDDDRPCRIGDPEWTAYVLSLLVPSEKVETNRGVYPRAAGLRRVANKLLGLISISTHVAEAPSPMNNGRATVVCDVSYRDDDEGVISASGAADCFKKNSTHPFYYHPTSTAETRAEGRALKRLLCLDVFTIEEMDVVPDYADDDETPEDETKTQTSGYINGLRSLMKVRKVDEEKLLASVGVKGSNGDVILSLSKMTPDQCQAVMTELMAVINSGNIPDSIKIV